MRKSLLLSLAMLITAGMAFAQDRTVSGKITSSEDGSAIPGVNVVVKGTTTGAVTDIDGNYKLSVPAEGGTLVFSFIGLETQEVEIGSRSVIDISMASDAEQLSEVVVTAIGIEQEKVAIGYGISVVDNDLIENRQNADIGRILRGKATGVDIQATSGLAGSGTNIIIRGYSSISGTNQPFFVVDGIPFNTNTNTGNQGFGTGSATASSRFLDIDPNNIEDITILKGLSATVLYGEAGRNGVVLVTTKTGKGGGSTGKKMEISFSQGVYVSEVANIPEYQNSFGNGFNAGFGWYFSNWGAAFNDLSPTSYGSDYKGITNQNGFDQVLITHPYDQAQYAGAFPEYAGADYIYQPYQSVENFFSKGVAANTSVSVAGGLGTNASFSASYSFLSDQGFTPKLDALRDNGRSNFLEKHNFGLGVEGKLQNGLKINGSFNYVTSSRLTPITAPAFGGDGNGLFAAIMFTPRSMDLMGLPYQSPIDGSNVYYRRGSPIQNPRWTLNNSGQSEDLSRFFSSTALSYDLGKSVTLLYRLSLDTYSQKNERYINKGGARVPDGEMRTFNIRSNTIDHIFNVMGNFDLSESLNLSGVLGFNARTESFTQTGTTSTQQFVYNLLNHSNFINTTAFSQLIEETVMGAYFTATLSYNDYLYFNLQGRNDWTSTLEKGNNSIFYPSASLSFLVTEAFQGITNNNILNYLKLRFGYGTSAGYPNPYQTRNTLDSETNQFVSAGGAILNTNGVSNSLGNSNLTPELHTEMEAGLEAKLFNGKLGIDASFYNKQSSDLIIGLPLDPATGYTRTTVNAAEIENKGIELGLNISPLNGPLQWNIIINYTLNRNNVISIFEGIERVQVSGGGYQTLGNYAIPNEPYGVQYGSNFLRDPASGLLVVDGQGNYQNSGQFDIIGDPNPDYIATWINSLTWKGISFGFQFSYRKGGDMYSSTVQALLARGNTVDTDVDRNIPLIMPNSVKQTGTDANGEAIYAPNDIQGYIGDQFFRAYFFSREGGMFDGTVIRLREVSLAYALPASLLEKTPFGTVAIAISGENLWFNAPNFPKGTNFDPEVSSVGVGNGRGFDFRTAPTAKKYGVNLTLTF
jgi:TonB-linked SusC/RagA family outer membrane protein